MEAAKVSRLFASREAVVEARVEALVSPLVSPRLASLVSSSIVTSRLARGVVRLSLDDGVSGRAGCMSSVESEYLGGGCCRLVRQRLMMKCA